MKHVLLALSLCLPVCAARAQQQPPAARAANLKNEAGAFFQTNAIGNSTGTDLLLGGAQYTRWVTPQLGFRILGAYGSYASYSGPATYVPNLDTVLTKDHHTRIRMPLIGGGLVAQRHFYKRIYLFAGLEVRGGYGTGTSDTLVRTFAYNRASGNSESTSETITGGSRAGMLMIGAAASIGAKVVYSRLTMGLELLPVQMTYQDVKYGTGSTGTADFTIGDFSQRIFLNYRF